MDALVETIKSLLAFGIVEDDPRMPYLTVQIDRDVIDAARALIESMSQ